MALNVQNTPIETPHLTRPQPFGDPGMGLWANGTNCGRWVKITLLEDCLGLGLTASDPPDVCGVNPFEENPLLVDNYTTDSRSGTTMYAVVADSCQGVNLTCVPKTLHGTIVTFLARTALNLNWSFLLVIQLSEQQCIIPWSHPRLNAISAPFLPESCIEACCCLC